MKKCLELAYIYHDPDFVELSVSVWNGRFGGQTGLYLDPKELGKAARDIAGFPSGPLDSRELAFGVFDPRFAGGGVRLSFSCRDMAAHPELRVMLTAEQTAPQLPETVSLTAPFEPAALDEFVHQLAELTTTLDNRAELRFTLR